MKRELRDELEVPGHVVAFQTKTKAEMIKEVREILDSMEATMGKNPKLRDIPEGDQKQRLRDLMKALGMNVRF
ncbi:hypothetical protein IIA15_09540 [candidate division TA06 bacterium]|nr:hypothetical protein [candidate division TA06 bacterium]